MIRVKSYEWKRNPNKNQMSARNNTTLKKTYMQLQSLLNPNENILSSSSLTGSSIISPSPASSTVVGSISSSSATPLFFRESPSPAPTSVKNTSPSPSFSRQSIFSPSPSPSPSPESDESFSSPRKSLNPNAPEFTPKSPEPTDKTPKKNK